MQTEMGNNAVTPYRQQFEKTPSSDDKTMAILAHILTLVAGFLAPLIIYLVKKDTSPYVAAQAKESLNFQISMTLISIVLCITIIGILLVWPLMIFSFICTIIASVKASDNQIFRYPLNIRFIK